MNLHSVLFDQKSEDTLAERVARRDWLKSFGLAGLLLSGKTGYRTKANGCHSRQ